ncbi:MAG: hypothetical protein ACPLRW_11185 [Moorellales bacterium]
MKNADGGYFNRLGAGLGQDLVDHLLVQGPPEAVAGPVPEEAAY